MNDLDRRKFVQTVAGGLAAPVMGSLPASGEAAPRAGQSTRTRPPNVIIMICDDLGSGDLGCYGSKIPTPNLDRMAAEGIRFTHFNTAHPLCTASRAALLTGRYANRSHCKGAFLVPEKLGMDLDEKTLADMLKAHGYKTMCIGKWHLGHTPEYMPTRRGFESFYGVPYSDDMKPLPLYNDTTVLEEDTHRELLTPRYTEAAVKFIDRNAAHPFFLYLAYSYPHDPARASARFRGKSKFGRVGDSIEEIDWSVGVILAALKRNGLDSETIVMFTSDHGPWYQGNPGALRGRKGTTFEGGTRVPFVIRWSGNIPAGTTTAEWGSNLDVVPTILSICGAAPGSLPLDGIDMSSFLAGHKNTIERGTMLYFSCYGLNEILECARKGDWKLRVVQRDGEMYVLDGASKHGSEYLLATPELYNLQLDPAESYDVASENPEIVKEIQKDIEALLPTFPDNVVKLNAEMQAHLGNKLTPPGASPISTNYEFPYWKWTERDD